MKKKRLNSEKPEKTEKSGDKRDAAEKEFKETADQLKTYKSKLTLLQI